MSQRSSDRTPRGAPPTAVLGPTNTGKTHYAIERMLAYSSGMIGLPLRLLAREVYDRIVERRGAKDVALVTGEEKIAPPTARYWICTVEAMPTDRTVDCLAIDEIQLAGDPERGRIFTSRLLSARGTYETLFLGSETMRPLIRRLFPDAKILTRDRFSVIGHIGSRKVTRLPRRSAIVGFSADTVYSVAELVRRQRGGAAVILGALSPRTRNAQAALYQSGEVDYLVATDAIGMGLNMDIDHVAFAGRRKFDGRNWRDLRHDEMAQIAGRAGRYMRDGTFGATGDCPELDEETVGAIENHHFSPLTALQWRSEDLHFATPAALLGSLATPAPRTEFVRARQADDEDALARLLREDDVRDLATGGDALRLLWRVCETPDFRKATPDAHARLLGEVFLALATGDRIKDDWLAPRINRLERTDGDLDSISNRLAHMRTFTYLSHRAEWLEHAGYWQERTRAIEDALSDALHEKLTQRFVDKRTSVLLKKLKDDEPILAGVNEDGEVIVEGQFVGRLLGFEFIVDPRLTGPDARRLRAASERALAPVFAARAAALANAAPDELSLRDDGAIWWRDGAVAMLKKGPAPLRPSVAVRGLAALPSAVRGRIQDRLDQFFSARIESLLSELVALQVAANSTAEGGLHPQSRGIAYRLVENFGAMSRTQFGEELKQLEQGERAKLRNLGVRFGEFMLFMPSLLKPAPARLLTLLFALWTERAPASVSPPKAGLVSFRADGELPAAYYSAGGYRLSGARAVRIDMIERLAIQIRAARRDDLKGGFEATSQMMSLVGCSGDEFESILDSLGFRKQTVTVRRPVSAPAATEAAPIDAAAPAASEDANAPDAQSAPPANPEPNGEATIDAIPAPATDSAPVAGPDVQLHDVEISIWRQQPRRAPPVRRPAREPRDATTSIGAREAERGDDRRRNPARSGGRPDERRRDDERRGEQRRSPDAPSDRRRPPERSRSGPPKGGGAPRNDRPSIRLPGETVHLKNADPNSPFAVLAGLKENLMKQQSSAAGEDEATKSAE